MKEEDIIEMIASGYPWEQVIYRIVGEEGLDPWNLDLKALSASFLKHIAKLKNLDFNIPAKYLIIASVLLRMKSDHLEFIDMTGGDEELEMEMEDLEMEEQVETSGLKFSPKSINIPEKRKPKRKVTFEDLVSSLKKAIKTKKRKEKREIRRKEKLEGVEISREDITERINQLYKKIDGLISKLKKEEVEFSRVVEEWKKEKILKNLTPLLQLDYDGKVNCRQERPFEEILIKKAG